MEVAELQQQITVIEAQTMDISKCSQLLLV
jgi:hypothetical protein